MMSVEQIRREQAAYLRARIESIERFLREQDARLARIRG